MSFTTGLVLDAATGTLAAARMTTNSAAFQTNTLGSNFTTTSGSAVDTGLSLTPATARTRAVVFVYGKFSINSAGATASFVLTNSNGNAALNIDEPALNSNVGYAIASPTTTMGTVVKLQASVTGANTLTIQSANSLMFSMEF